MRQASGETQMLLEAQVVEVQWPTLPCGQDRKNPGFLALRHCAFEIRHQVIHELQRDMVSDARSSCETDVLTFHLE